MSADAMVYWLDGRLRPREVEGVVLPADGPRCYTTALVENGTARFAAQHVRRLQRDAAQIGLGAVSEALALDAFRELGHAVFGDGAGIVRIIVERGAGRVPRMRAEARALGRARPLWSAVTAPFPHDGPDARSGAKLMDTDVYTRARALAEDAGTDEAVLFDDEGRLVEGARSNIVVVTADARIVTPDLALGAVRGTTLEVLRAKLPRLEPARIARNDVRIATEVIAVNAVRGARAIVLLDGEPVGTGAPGPWSSRLDATLAERAD